MKNQEVVREVQEVIENAVTQSKRVMRALRRLEQAGYELRFAIAAKKPLDSKLNSTLPSARIGSNPPLLVLTDLDARFLKALRIKADQ